MALNVKTMRESMQRDSDGVSLVLFAVASVEGRGKKFASIRPARSNPCNESGCGRAVGAALSTDISSF